MNLTFNRRAQLLGKTGRDGMLPSLPSSSPRSVRAFTMIEIALSLAVIGFALVAILGVLPIGMSSQKDNREQTIINADAAFLMDAIRSGSQGQDSLTNFIISITNISTVFDATGNPTGVQNISWYTRTASSINGTPAPPLLTSDSNIVGLLTIPRYTSPGPGMGYTSNSVTAVFRGINGPAVDMGASQSSRDFAFQYQVTVEIVPSSQYAFPATDYPLPSPQWQNLSSPGTIPAATNIGFGFLSPDQQTARNLQNNLNEIRLFFRWPVLGSGQLGGGRQVFRSLAAGRLALAPIPPGAPLLFGYFIQPLNYANAP